MTAKTKNAKTAIDVTAVKVPGLILRGGSDFGQNGDTLQPSMCSCCDREIVPEKDCYGQQNLFAPMEKCRHCGYFNSCRRNTLALALVFIDAYWAFVKDKGYEHKSSPQYKALIAQVPEYS